MPIAFLIILLLIIIFIGLYIKYLFFTPEPKRLIQDLTQVVPPEASCEIINKQNFEEFHSKPLPLRSIEHEIKELLSHQIKNIFFMHGTFVGDDPFHLLSLIEDTFLESDHLIISKFKNQTRKLGAVLTKDLGNFSEDHVNLIENFIADDIKVENITWSSANHHYARVSACLNLIKKLSQIKIDKKSKILFLGHSHAGQIFALMSQMINHQNMAIKLIKILEFDDNKEKEILSNLKKIKMMNFIFTTFGSPSRYSWELNKKTQLIHFINHRTKDFLGGQSKNFLTTKDGDYIQQWGVPGSDMISPIKKEQLINEKLNELLGVGYDHEIFRENIQFRHRLHNQGHHYLVDYNDQGKTPNFLKTGFGHGVYTKLDLLPFHLHLINQYLKN